MSTIEKCDYKLRCDRPDLELKMTGLNRIMDLIVDMVTCEYWESRNVSLVKDDCGQNPRRSIWSRLLSRFGII